MIYDPIPVILLSTLASEKDHSTNQMIAEFILTHRQQAAQMNIGDLARECHAGTASVSRFCRDIGLSDFASLKLLLQNTDFSFEQVSDNLWMPPQITVRTGAVTSAALSPPRSKALTCVL